MRLIGKKKEAAEASLTIYFNRILLFYIFINANVEGSSNSEAPWDSMQARRHEFFLFQVVEEGAEFFEFRFVKSFL